MVDIDTNATIYLGVWHLVPEDLVNNTIYDPDFNYEMALAHSSYPVVVYFHGNSGTRIAPLSTYGVLRQFFHVIAFDYRRKYEVFDLFLIPSDYFEMSSLSLSYCVYWKLHNAKSDSHWNNFQIMAIPHRQYCLSRRW